LRPDDDILKHPAFAGFARLVLPSDDRRSDVNMPLRNVGSLLPYHTHVHPAIVVSALSRTIDDANDGKRIFYDIYAAQLAETLTHLPFYAG
jgi:hypothetical protein